MYSTAPPTANEGGADHSVSQIWYNTTTQHNRRCDILSGKTQPTQHSFAPYPPQLLVHWKYLAKFQAQIEE